ncbi:MAG TPA: hypothetical protein VF690_03250 [Hymenobacter sp.]
MRKFLNRWAYRLGIAPTTTDAFFVSAAGELCHRRWLPGSYSSPLERPVAHFSSTGQLLVHQ